MIYLIIYIFVTFLVKQFQVVNTSHFLHTFSNWNHMEFYKPGKRPNLVGLAIGRVLGGLASIEFDDDYDFIS